MESGGGGTREGAWKSIAEGQRERGGGGHWFVIVWKNYIEENTDNTALCMQLCILVYNKVVYKILYNSTRLLQIL